MVTKVLKGHKSRGEEVIELLQMLGGKNTAGFKSTFTGFYYWIDENNEIVTSDMPPQNSMVYPLEDFEDEYPYKVGDCVRYFPHKVSVIKSMFISYDDDVKYELEGVDDSFFQAHQLEYVGRTEYCERKENNKNMTNIAIKGHPTRDKEVIQLLEMLGGKNRFDAKGDCNNVLYVLCDDEIQYLKYADAKTSVMTIYTLEEFEDNFPYKVGDKVLYIPENKTYFIRKMFWKNDKVVYELSDEIYTEGCSIPDTIIFDVDVVKLQPYKEENYCQVIGNDISSNGVNTSASSINEETMGEKGTLVQIDLTKEMNVNDEVEVILGDYEFVLKDGKTYFVKKKPQYPKTYEECCDVLGKTKAYQSVSGYKTELLEYFQQLLICRDAYWKIAGEEMGLGKPWGPDWSTENECKYVIEVYRNNVRKNSQGYFNTLLAFPTEEMRDVFYENFKTLIEECKELL